MIFIVKISEYQISKFLKFYIFVSFRDKEHLQTEPQTLLFLIPALAIKLKFFLVCKADIVALQIFWPSQNIAVLKVKMTMFFRKR